MFEPRGEFGSFVEASMREWRVPGLAVAVVEDGEVVYEGAFGLRDVEHRLPVTTETLFLIGSSTKAFTAMAVAMLVDGGAIELDTPIIEYLPEFRLHDEYATLHATPRDLLCHRTGVPAYDALWLLTGLGRDEVLGRVRHLRPNAAFRDRFQYNNLMYVILGRLIERVSGQSWEEFVAERIFAPLGMDDSYTVTPRDSDNLAQPYRAANGEAIRIPRFDLSQVAPAGGITSTAADMARWLLLHTECGAIGDLRLLSEAGLKAVRGPNMAIRDHEICGSFGARTYGLGWYLSDYRGHELIEHGGSIDGFAAQVSFMPGRRAGVVVLTNTLNLLTHVIERNIYDRLLALDPSDRNRELREVLARLLACSPCAAAAAGDEKETRLGTTPSLSLDAYRGTYWHPAFGPVEVEVEEDILVARFPKGPSFDLEHVDLDVFRARGSMLAGRKLQFRLDRSSRIESLLIPLEPVAEDTVFAYHGPTMPSSDPPAQVGDRH